MKSKPFQPKRTVIFCASCGYSVAVLPSVTLAKYALHNNKQEIFNPNWKTIGGGYFELDERDEEIISHMLNKCKLKLEVY